MHTDGLRLCPTAQADRQEPIVAAQYKMGMVRAAGMTGAPIAGEARPEDATHDRPRHVAADYGCRPGLGRTGWLTTFVRVLPVCPGLWQT